jgi:Domain of unknown function (DUF6702)
VVAVLALTTLLAARHPIHSSAASLTLRPDGRSAAVVVRVFADDFPPGREPGSIDRYLAARFRLSDAAGNPLGLKLDAVNREGPVLLLRLTAELPHGLAGVRVWHGVLAERFTDQVNIVQAHYAGRTVSLLFTASDGPKPLP